MLCSQDYPDERYEVWVVMITVTTKHGVVRTTKAEYDQEGAATLCWASGGKVRGAKSGVATDAG